MEDWKTAGWVPDSDEEDLDIAIPEPAPSSVSTPGPQPVAVGVPDGAASESTGRANILNHDVFDGEDEQSEEDELAAPAPAQRTIKRVYKLGWKSRAEQADSQDARKFVAEGSIATNKKPGSEVEGSVIPDEPVNRTPKNEVENREARTNTPKAQSTDAAVAEDVVTDGEDLTALQLKDIQPRTSPAPLTDQYEYLNWSSTPLEDDGQAADTTKPMSDGGSVNSLSSSPLTVASRSPEAPPTWACPDNAQSTRSVPRVVIPLDIPRFDLNSQTGTEDVSLASLEPSLVNYNRSFRQRKAIQVHPYMLEAERYKKDMHARGIRATIVRHSGNSEVQQENEEDDTQQFQPSQPSSPGLPPSTPLQTDTHSPLRDVYDGHDLLNEGYSRSSRPTTLQRPLKRRKLVHASSVIDEPLGLSGTSLAGTLPTPSNSDGPPRLPSSNTKAAKSKSSLSVASASTPRRPGFVVPRQFRSPSPSISPDNRQQHAEPDSSPPIQSITRRRTVQIIDSGSEDESARSQEEKSRSASDREEKKRSETATWKRRLAGVLPASYTTLATKISEAARKKSLHAKAPIRRNQDLTARGVARHISSHRKSPIKGTQRSPIIFSDDVTPPASPTQAAVELRTSPQQRRSPVNHETENWPDIDDMEDDAVDFMPQVASGRKRPTSNRSTRPRKRLRQSKVSGHFQRDAGHRTTTWRKSTKKLGILDAERKSPQARRPDFVRVAARKARARQDQGRTSPSRKAFRLHRESDDRDVREILENWRATRVIESLDASSDDGLPPLGEISGNQQTPLQKRSDDEPPEPHRRQQPKAKKAAPRLQRRRPREKGIGRMEESLLYAAEKRDIVKSMKASRTPAKPAMKRGSGSITQHIGPLQNAGPGQLSVPMLDDQPPPVLPPVSPGPHTSAEFPAVEALQRQPEQAATESGEYWIYRPRKRLLRKRPPRQTELAFRSFGDERETEEENPANIGSLDNLLDESAHSKIAVQLPGLELWTAGLDSCFGIQKLPTGFLFPSSSFLGSGRFASCLGSVSRSANLNTSQRTPWSDELRSKLSAHFSEVRSIFLLQSSRADEDQALRHLEDVANVLAHKVHFPDPVDRKSLLRHVLVLINGTLQALPDDNSQLGTDGSPSETLGVFRCQTSARLALLAYQLIEEGQKPFTPADIITEIKQAFKDCIQDFASHVDKHGLATLRRFIRQYQDLSFAPHEVATALAESFVILKALITEYEPTPDGIMGLLPSIRTFTASKSLHEPRAAKISILEQQWRAIFTVQPLLDIGTEGWSVKDAAHEGNWSLVKQVTKPVLRAYEIGLAERAAYFHPYCRTLFVRCFKLIDQWQWQGCDSIIGFLFDFFARNGLSNLRFEDCHHSPVFLNELADEPELKLQAGDCCFHVLLKIIVVGIRNMRVTSTEKRIRDLVYRLLPNHDRHFPKAQEPRILDLDASRNHHDVLCALYWAAPTSGRPDLKHLIGLVREDGSHTSVYLINIQAWLNLVRFQISCDSTQNALGPFAAWHDNILERLLRQHASVRTEIEEEAREAEDRNGQIFNTVTKERTIAKNQRQIEIVLLTLLEALADAVERCPSSESASVLLTAVFGRVLRMFDSKQTRLDDLLIKAFKVISCAAKRDQRLGPTLTDNTEEDSQGFDWEGFEEIETTDLPPPEPVFKSQVYQALHQSLSSCLGANLTPSDELLRPLVDAWADVVLLYNAKGTKTWDNYLGNYGHDTWVVLADTEQKRRYTPYFHVRLLDSDTSLWRSQRQLILRTWLVSLTDREAQLKFQGDLTASILNVCSNDSLLADLPFLCKADGKFKIMLQDIKRHRVALLDTILSNMRKSASANEDPATISDRKADYQVLIQDLMQAMKTRYQELGSENESQSAYVGFVQAIVKSLQEHCQDLCQLDPFFTSSAAFPLPVDDPEYVASRVKAYGLRLSDSRAQRQLATFVLSIVERSIYDGATEQMIQQLCTSAEVVNGREATPGLKVFLLHILLPSYIYAATSNSCGWLFATPLLAATGQILARSSFTLDGCTESSVHEHLSLFTTVFRPFQALFHFDSLFTSPFPVSTAKLLASIFDLITYNLHILTYIFYLRPSNKTRALSSICGFIEGLITAQEKIQGLSAVGQLEIEPSSHVQKRPSEHLAKGEVPEYIRKGLDTALSQRTRHQRHVYSVKRIGTWKVVSDMHDTRVLKEELRNAAARFERAVERSPAFEHLL